MNRNEKLELVKNDFEYLKNRYLLDLELNTKDYNEILDDAIEYSQLCNVSLLCAIRTIIEGWIDFISEDTCLISQVNGDYFIIYFYDMNARNEALENLKHGEIYDENISCSSCDITQLQFHRYKTLGFIEINAKGEIVEWNWLGKPSLF